MNQPFYEFTILDEALRYEFVSEGKSIIHKVVSISHTDSDNLFTLTLADIRLDGSLDTHIASNNGDLKAIIATVIKCLETFFVYYPAAAVAFTGSEPRRMRLYQIILNRELTSLQPTRAVLFFGHFGRLNRELTSLQPRFNIWGISDEGIVTFTPNHTYEGFIVSLKSVIIA